MLAREPDDIHGSLRSLLRRRTREKRSGGSRPQPPKPQPLDRATLGHRPVEPSGFVIPAAFPFSGDSAISAVPAVELSRAVSRQRGLIGEAGPLVGSASFVFRPYRWRQQDGPPSGGCARHHRTQILRVIFPVIFGGPFFKTGFSRAPRASRPTDPATLRSHRIVGNPSETPEP